MDNGQEKEQANFEAFQNWIAIQTDENFKQIVYRGNLNHGELLKPVALLNQFCHIGVEFVV